MPSAPSTAEVHAKCIFASFSRYLRFGAFMVTIFGFIFGLIFSSFYCQTMKMEVENEPKMATVNNPIDECSIGGSYKKDISLNVGDDSRKKKNDGERREISRKNHRTQPIRLRVFDQSDCKLSTNQIASFRPIRFQVPTNQKRFTRLSPYNCSTPD